MIGHLVEVETALLDVVALAVADPVGAVFLAAIVGFYARCRKRTASWANLWDELAVLVLFDLVG